MPCAGLSCASWSLRKKTHSLACAARTRPPHPQLLFSKVLANSLLHSHLEQEGPQPPWGGETRAEVGAAARLVGNDVKCRWGRRFPDASSAARVEAGSRSCFPFTLLWAAVFFPGSRTTCVRCQCTAACGRAERCLLLDRVTSSVTCPGVFSQEMHHLGNVSRPRNRNSAFFHDRAEKLRFVLKLKKKWTHDSPFGKVLPLLL